MKVSRPIVYTIVFAVAAYAVFLYTQPDTPAKVKKHSSLPLGTTQTASADGILPEDRTAHFLRFTKASRDPFLPLVAKNPKTVVLGSSGKDSWQLTGIDDVDGVKAALIENSATSESAFLHQGDRWNGSVVVAIGDSSVTMQNDTGQQSIVTFPTPDASPSPGAPSFIPNSNPRLGAGSDASFLTARPQGGLPASLPAPPGFTTAQNQ